MGYRFKKVVGGLFLIAIFTGGLLTFISSPRQILGGFARGYIKSEETNSIFQKIENGFQTMEGRVDSFFILHDQAINLHGALQRVLGKNLVEDSEETVIRLKNDYLIFEPSALSLKAADNMINRMKEYQELCSSYDADLLYVKKPRKGTSDTDLLPSFYPYSAGTDYSDYMLEQLSAMGISTLDLNKLLDKSGDKYQYFFKTDHHWIPRTGLWAAQIIASTLNEKENVNLDTKLLDIRNFNIELYEDSCVGSQGRRVGLYYVGKDDFEIITPKFDTSMTLSSPANGDRCGTFEDCLIHREHLIATLERPLTMDTIIYDVYMNGNDSLVKVTNANSSSVKKCLLVMDSFGCVMAPYLALEFSELDCIDIRLYSERIEEFIQENRPDVVVYMLDEVQQ